eukprot:Hpha_TRINITY_DN11632_c1_g1::TRINITY_DN11632_c1_g1_i1::g.49130::m.49130
MNSTVAENDDDDFESFLDSISAEPTRDSSARGPPSSWVGSRQAPQAIAPGDPLGRKQWDVSRHVDPNDPRDDIVEQSGSFEDDDDRGYFAALSSTDSVGGPGRQIIEEVVLPRVEDMTECSVNCFAGCSVAAEEPRARAEYANAEHVFRCDLRRRERSARLSAAGTEELKAVVDTEGLVRDLVREEEVAGRGAVELTAHHERQDVAAALLRRVRVERRAAQPQELSPTNLVLLLDGAIVRSGPSLSSRRVARLRRGAVVTVRERLGPRARIERGPLELQGWISVQNQIGEVVCREATSDEESWAAAQRPSTLCTLFGDRTVLPPIVNRGARQSPPAQDGEGTRGAAEEALEERPPPHAKPDAPLPVGTRIRRWGRSLLDGW